MEFSNRSENILTKVELLQRLNNDLFIRPLLEPDKQVNEIGIDFRLGYDFMVTVHGREAYLNASLNSDAGHTQRNLRYFFQESRRQIGETFILHPNQTILATSLEYIKLPDNLMLILFLRSSYNRLGLSISAIVQPGYCGCISLELTNLNFTPINLTVGARILQGIFMPVSNSTNYFDNIRKYLCQVRPEASAATEDSDLQILNQVWQNANHKS